MSQRSGKWAAYDGNEYHKCQGSGIPNTQQQQPVQQTLPTQQQQHTVVPTNHYVVIRSWEGNNLAEICMQEQSFANTVTELGGTGLGTQAYWCDSKGTHARVAWYKVPKNQIQYLPPPPPSS